jgi:hypothetical protein
MTKQSLKALSQRAGKPKTPLYIPREYIEKPLEERAEIFLAHLREVCSNEPPVRIKAFYDYWTAPLQDAPNVMRMEAEDTWSTKGRMATWRRFESVTHDTPQTRIIK